MELITQEMHLVAFGRHTVSADLCSFYLSSEANNPTNAPVSYAEFVEPICLFVGGFLSVTADIGFHSRC
jgi:hypothetical protein